MQTFVITRMLNEADRMNRFNTWRWEAALWIIAVLALAALAYLLDGEHATFALALNDQLITEAGASAFGFAVALVFGLAAYVMFETAVMANVAIIGACAVWLLKLYFWG
jgi:hypothetical protein